MARSCDITFNVNRASDGGLKLNVRRTSLFFGWFLCITPPLFLHLSSFISGIIRYGGVVYLMVLLLIYMPWEIRITKRTRYFAASLLAFLMWSTIIVLYRSSDNTLSFLKSDIIPVVEVVLLLVLSIKPRSVTVSENVTRPPFRTD